MTNYLLAGGGTAGHVNPLIALADQIMAANHKDQVWALGTVEGLESRLIPAEGYELLTIERLPFPRRPNFYAVKFPMKFTRAVSRVQKFIKTHQIDVVVGFGGYASAPAYVAAKRSGIPFVVHEANALPGWANKFGARNAAAVAVAFTNTPLPKAVHVGMPLRAEIEFLNKEKDVSAARQNFGLDADTVTLLVTGGSLGAKRINETIEASRAVLSAAGIQVLHIVGDKSDLAPVQTADYVRIGYCDEMATAIAASSFAISRAGASTVSEFAAVGLPAAYVPYPVGNGEQRYNVAELVKAGGAFLVEDSAFTPDYVAQEIIPLLSSSKLLKAMADASKQHGVSDGAKRLLTLIKGVL